jgi:aspartyl-tRNA(Asn)/glutamyl-tRNA(Gln) amidotransferase subunit C
MDIEQVRKVARLARLNLSDEELALYGRQLTAIVEYVSLLDEVDIDNVEPMPHAVEMQNKFREDVVLPSLPVDAALANAPQTDGRCFQVPQILEDKGSR